MHIYILRWHLFYDTESDIAYTERRKKGTKTFIWDLHKTNKKSKISLKLSNLTTGILSVRGQKDETAYAAIFKK